MKKLFYALLCTTAFISCKKDVSSDPITPIVPTCKDINTYKSAWSAIPDSTYSNLQNCITFFGGSISEYTLTKYNYHFPCFNPKNENEMCYIREVLQPDFQSAFELWYFDLCTGKGRFLAKSYNSAVDWSVKGWIAFADSSSYLSKIKPNGDSLTQYKDIFFMNYPRWNSDGTKLLVSFAADMYLVDENGANRTQLLSNVYAADWSADGKKIVCSRYNSNLKATGVGIFDITAKAYTEIQSVPIGSDLKDLQVVKGTDDFYWSHGGNIFKSNATTKQTATVLNGAGNRQYRYITMTPSKKSLLVQRCNRVKISDCEFTATNGFSIMDIDGKNEQKFTLPD